MKLERFLIKLKEIIRIYISKIVKAYKEGGILLIFKRMVCLCFETNSADWYDEDLSSNINAFEASVPVKIDFDNIDEVIDWLKKDGRDWMIVPQEIELAREQGHYFATAKVNGNIVGCIKLCFGKVFIMDYKMIIKFPEKIVFGTDFFILPEYRGRKLAVTEYFFSETLLFLKQKGFLKYRNHIPSWNISSLKGKERHGGRKLKTIKFIRIFNFKFITSNPGKL
jgi:hypothetical protein